MDFNHTEDRRMLSDSLRRYLSDQYSHELRIETAYEAPFHSEKHYQELCQLGVLAALVPESAGGYGGSGFDIQVVFEELGRALCPEPALAALMSLRLLQACDAKDLLAEAMAGERKLAVAIYEPGNSDSLDTLTTNAQQSGDDWVLNGQKSIVYGAPAASDLLVVARTDAGLGVFLTDQAQVEGYAMIDGGGAGEVRLVDAHATCLSSDAQAAIEYALDCGRLALCAEAVGAMDVLLEMTVEYLSQRQQFGTTIATFQALQHRIVDMAIEIEQARSMTILAASKLDEEDRARYLAMAKNLIGRSAQLIGEESTQLHGGIGMTWEYAGAHYAKRLIMLDHQLGDRYQQLDRLHHAA